MHGGRDNTIVNNVGVFVEGTAVGGLPDEFFMRIREATSGIPSEDFPAPSMTGNLVEINIMFSINSSGNPATYDNTAGTGATGTTAENNWMEIGLEAYAPMTLRDNIRWEHIDNQTKGGSTETGSVDSDPLFVDFANDDYDLQGGSPAYAKGWVDIDYTKLGLLGYDRSNY